MNKKIKNPEHILWLDLEMTGLSSAKDDLILEVAAIITDWNFKELGIYEGIVKNDPETMGKRMKVNGEFWDEYSQTRDAILAQNELGDTAEKIEKKLMSFINKHFKKDEAVLLAGNSIHYDRRFIIEHWPKLEERLYPRMLDVSAWKVVFENKYKKKFVKENNHRALDDIRGSIIELQYYLKTIKQ